MVDPKLKRPMVGDTDEGNPPQAQTEKGPNLSQAEPPLSPSFHPVVKRSQSMHYFALLSNSKVYRFTNLFICNGLIMLQFWHFPCGPNTSGQTQIHMIHEGVPI